MSIKSISWIALFEFCYHVVMLLFPLPGLSLRVRPSSTFLIAHESMGAPLLPESRHASIARHTATAYDVASAFDCLTDHHVHVCACI